MRTECPMSLIKVVPNGLTCFLCDEDFNRGTIYYKVEHLVTKHHGGVEPYRCHSCHVAFIDEKDAFSHYRAHHFHQDFVNVRTRNPEIAKIEGTSVTTYRCLRCGVMATSPLAYWYHCWTRHRKYRHAACPICRETFRTSTEFRRHFLIEHFNFGYFCPLCHHETQTKGSMNGHLVRCHGKAEANSKSPPTSQERALVNDDSGLKNPPPQGTSSPPKKIRKKKHLSKLATSDPNASPKAEANSESTLTSQERALVNDDSSLKNPPPDGTSSPLNKIRKKKRLSKLATSDPNASRKARANSKIPLTHQERALVNADLCLKSPSPHLQGLGNGTFDPATRNLLELHHDWMKNRMPAIIDNQQTLMSWLTLLNRVGEVKMNYGVPGETFCFECNQDCLKMSRLQMHILEKHEKMAPYACPKDCYEFTEDGWGLQHIVSTHPELSTESPNNSYCHDPISTDQGHLRCPFCSLVARSEFSYWYHINSSHRLFKKGLCPDPDCQAPFNTAKQFRYHGFVDHAFYKFVCTEPECSKTFGTSLQFKAHIRFHFDKVVDVNSEQEFSFYRKKKGKVPSITCDICGVISKTENIYKKHMFNQHNVMMPMSCPKCQAMLEGPVALERHKKVTHGVGSCHICAHIFLAKADVDRHMASKHGIVSDNLPTLICEICSKPMNSESAMKEHFRKTHGPWAKEKNFKCSMCDKAYRWKASLSGHIASAHLSENNRRAYSCEFCGKTFADASNFKNHRYTHTQEKPYQCSDCGKGFIRKDCLRSHTKTCQRGSIAQSILPFS